MGKASPAFQFYAQDFLVGTMTMSAAARGCYISMLAFSWVNGPIPDTPKSLALAMCWGPTDGLLDPLWAEIKPKWSKTAEGWTNARLEAVRDEQEAYRQRQSDRGKLGGRPRSVTVAERYESSGLGLIKPEESLGLAPVKPEPKREAKPEESSSPLTFAFDLRSSSSPLPSTSVSQGQNRPTHRPRQSIFGGVHPNCDPATFSACNRSMCVPPFVVKAWRGQMGAGPDTHAYIQSFVDEVMAKCPEGVPIGDEPLKFWRAQWQAKHGTLVKSGFQSNGDATMDAARRLAAKYEAEAK